MFEAVGQDRVVAGADQQFADHVSELFFAAIRRAEDAAAAGREIDHRVALAAPGDGRFTGVRHVFLPGAAGNPAEEVVAEHAGDGMAELEAEARGVGQGGEMLAGPGVDGATGIAELAAAQAAGQVASVDSDRTGGRKETPAGTSDEA